jgi:NAD(P)-dependent dehydrogenase (short-subunit alcohol dehydrogenase family)
MERRAVIFANRFAGRTALVTGGASGIGFAIARRLHTEGARVCLCWSIVRWCLQGFLISCPIETDSVVAAVANMPEQMQSLFLAACVNVESEWSLTFATAPDSRDTTPDIEQRITHRVMS